MLQDSRSSIGSSIDSIPNMCSDSKRPLPTVPLRPASNHTYNEVEDGPDQTRQELPPDQPAASTDRINEAPNNANGTSIRPYFHRISMEPDSTAEPRIGINGNRD